jgi:hypothetical protein
MSNLLAESEVHSRMVRHYALRLFFLCLIVCASLILFGIWYEPKIVSETYFKTAASFFIVGLASFLTWLSLILRAIYLLLLPKV